MNADAKIAWPRPTASACADWALDVLREERSAIDAFLAAPPASLGDVIELVAATPLPVICCGVGKSGLVAAKIAATLSSLGTPAFPLSVPDAAHGDLGAVMPGSVVLLFSNSGTTAEILRILPALRARRCKLVGFVGRAASPIGRAVDVLVPLPIAREADHIGMAPTSSTTLQMAVGDAVAVAVSRLRGFTRDDFLACHPAGQLGQHAMPIKTIMRSGDSMPTVLPHMPLAETIHVMSAGLMGAACVTDWDRKLLGLIVDGDIRRAIEARADLYALTAGAVMRANPVVLRHDACIGEALATMRGHGQSFLVLPVTDDAGQLVGMVHSVDLVQTL